MNVDRAVEQGSNQMKEFEQGWPKRFHEKISHRVKTQLDSETHQNNYMEGSGSATIK